MTVSNRTLDPIWAAVAELADEGSVRGKLDYRTGEGTGLTFTVDGVAYTIDLYRSEDVEAERVKAYGPFRGEPPLSEHPEYGAWAELEDEGS